MTSENNGSTVKATATINILAGIWLFLSPWVYQAYSPSPSAWNSWIVGALIVLFGVIRVSNPMSARGASIVNLLLGIWTFASPWIYGYTHTTGEFVNSLCVGVIVFVLATISSSMGHTMVSPPPPVRP